MTIEPKLMSDEELAEVAAAWIATTTPHRLLAHIQAQSDQIALLESSLAQANHNLDDCMMRGAALVAERDRYKQDFVAMADRACELAARISELESK